MFCSNCGIEIPEGSAFCANCGAKVNPDGSEVLETLNTAAEAPAPEAVQEAPAETVASEAAPAEDFVPEAAPAEAPESEAAPASAEPETAVLYPEAAEQPKKKGKRTLLIIIAAVIVAAIAAAVLFVLPDLFGGGSDAKPAYAYSTTKGELNFLKDLKEKTTPVEICDEDNAYYSVAFSKDAKYMYYVCDDTLYVIDTAKPESSEVKISGNVDYILYNSVLSGGRILYLKDGTQLKLYDGNKSTKISDDVESFYVDENEKYVYYEISEYDEDSYESTSSLYRVDLKTLSSTEELVSDVTYIYNNPTKGAVLYEEADWSDDEYSNELYYLEFGKEPQLVAEGNVIVNHIVSLKPGSTEFYYANVETNDNSMYDLVSDTYALSDENYEPPVHPTHSEYRVWAVYNEDGGWTYEDYYSYNHYPFLPTDEQLMAAGYSRSDFNSADRSKMYDIASAVLAAEYDRLLADYNARYEEWEEVSNRMDVREGLKNNLYTSYVYSIHSFKNGTDTELASGIESTSYPNITFFEQSGALVYSSTDVSHGTVADITDLEYYYDIYDYIESGAGATYNVCIGGNVSVLDMPEEFSGYSSTFDISSSEVAFNFVGYDDDGESEYALYSYKVAGNTLEFDCVIADGEYSNPVLVEVGGKNVIYYYTDYDEDDMNDGNLCKYDGAVASVASGIDSALVFSDGTTYVVTDTDYNSSTYRSEGTIARLEKDGKRTTVADEASLYYIEALSSSQFLLLSDTDLIYWNGKDSRRIDKKVQNVWANDAENDFTYVTLYPNDTYY